MKMKRNEGHGEAGRRGRVREGKEVREGKAFGKGSSVQVDIQELVVGHESHIDHLQDLQDARMIWSRWVPSISTQAGFSVLPL